VQIELDDLRTVKIQVVMPSLNQGRYIGAAIDSVLAQSADVNVELVIVDACSEDETAAEIDAALRRPHHASVTVIQEPDEGQADAINKGVAQGSGTIMSWLNADDLLRPRALNRVEHFFARAASDVVAVYGDLDFINAAGDPVGKLCGLPFLQGDILWGPGYIPQPATFVRRAAWEAVGGLRSDLHYVMDVDLWLRLSRRGRIEHLPEVLACFRLHDEQKTVVASRKMRAELRTVVQEHAQELLGRTPSVIELLLRRTAVRATRRVRRAVRIVRPDGAAG
jgi:glycosyltransferase involved in cell wall biosynthesis